MKSNTHAQVEILQRIESKQGSFQSDRFHFYSDSYSDHSDYEDHYIDYADGGYMEYGS